MKASFTGQLYQLFSKTKLSVGAYVAVNGPWDTFGEVQKSELHDSGQYLNQIRGVKARTGERPVASF